MSKSLLLSILVFLVCVPIVGAALFFPALILAGPHSSLLPSAIQPVVLIQGWVCVFRSPVLAGSNGLPAARAVPPRALGVETPPLIHFWPVADDVLRDSCFKQLTETLRALASEPSDQLALFPDFITKADDLAARFDDSVRAVHEDFETELSRSQAEVLERLRAQFATMSRDGAEFDADLWTAEAIRTSVHWREVRALAAAALVAFDLPLVDG